MIQACTLPVEAVWPQLLKRHGSRSGQLGRVLKEESRGNLTTTPKTRILGSGSKVQDTGDSRDHGL